MIPLAEAITDETKPPPVRPPKRRWCLEYPRQTLQIRPIPSCLLSFLSPRPPLPPSRPATCSAALLYDYSTRLSFRRAMRWSFGTLGAAIDAQRRPPSPNARPPRPRPRPRPHITTPTTTTPAALATCHAHRRRLSRSHQPPTPLPYLCRALPRPTTRRTSSPLSPTSTRTNPLHPSLSPNTPASPRGRRAARGTSSTAYT